jgi:6-phosphofructokinase 1
MYGFVKAISTIDPKAQIYGIHNGYAGLMDKDYRKMNFEEFYGMLNTGGTMLGTSRQSYKKFLSPEGEEKVALMKETYRRMDLDLLLILGGQGTHKTAALLSSEGLNVITLPKTIDNDIWGTDLTFGFHSAVSIATECIDRIKTTAASHGRVILVEIMGNKVGWLTLYAGMAAGADIIIIPEIPFDIPKLLKDAKNAINDHKGYCVIAVAEGAMDREEAKLSKKERIQQREERGEITASNRIASAISQDLGVETRVIVPGHIQRGGNPCAYDRVICMQIGAYAAKLAQKKEFGVAIAINGQKITHNKLADIAGETKFVSPDSQIIEAARAVGISFGD